MTTSRLSFVEVIVGRSPALILKNIAFQRLTSPDGEWRFPCEQKWSRFALTPLGGSFYIVRISQKSAQGELYAK
jgi:hypothetical protein